MSICQNSAYFLKQRHAEGSDGEKVILYVDTNQYYLASLPGALWRLK